VPVQPPGCIRGAGRCSRRAALGAAPSALLRPAPPPCAIIVRVVLESLLYLELLLFLAGALIYGFLARELARRPEVLPGNRPLRLSLVCLTLFYALTLAGYLLDFLLGPVSGWLAAVGAGLALVRGLAWLLTLPLLLHTLERIDALEVRGRSLPALRLLTLAGYLALALFVPALVDFVRRGGPLLAAAARRVQPLLVGEAAITLLPAAGLAAWLGGRMAGRWMAGRRLGGFFRALAALLVVLFALLAAGLVLDPWRADARGLGRLVRTLTLAGLLLPGGLVVFHVQRYNLLRLSLSNRALRHFLAVLLPALLVLLAGPAAAGRGVAEVRRFVAWGLLLALGMGLGLPPLTRRALARFPRLRALMGKSITPRELDRFLDSLESVEPDEAALVERTAAQLGGWLGSEAAWLPAPAAAADLAPLWRHLRDAPAAAVHRLSPPSPAVAEAMDRRGLHAVFALRVDGGLEGLLGLAASPTGGGYSDGELEAVHLVLRQLATTLTLRRLLAARLAEERRLAEQERLSLLGLVAASLAHEIKNPLAAMKTLAQALREDLEAAVPPGGAPLREGIEDLRLIVEQIDRLHQTTREILGLARPQEGRDTELAPLVASALYVLHAEARKRGVELDGAGVAEVGRVPGSPAAWQTVVFNVVLNAIAHTAGGGAVRVSLARREEGIELVTANPGRPLSAEEERRIFEPFVSDGGTGLGLPLVARRVRELGGTVAVDCAGGEVAFTVSLPAGAAAGAVPGAEMTATADAAGGGREATP
jgi:signal transduction histidine kinase